MSCVIIIKSELDVAVASVLGGFLTDCILGVRECLEPCLSWLLVLHLVDRLLDETQQVVDVLLREEFGFYGEVEEISVQNFDKQVEVLGLSHHCFGCLEGFAEIIHHLLAIFPEGAVEQS